MCVSQTQVNNMTGNSREPYQIWVSSGTGSTGLTSITNIVIRIHYTKLTLNASDFFKNGGCFIELKEYQSLSIA